MIGFVGASIFRWKVLEVKLGANWVAAFEVAPYQRRIAWDCCGLSQYFCAAYSIRGLI
jgi:hypothetical protein